MEPVQIHAPLEPVAVPLQEQEGEKERWAAISSIHNGRHNEMPEMCAPTTGGGEQVPTENPATSTPKKQKGNASSSEDTRILEGRYDGNAYHRDGTRIGLFHCQ